MRTTTLAGLALLVPAVARSQPIPFAGTTLQQTIAERWRNAGQPAGVTRYELRTDNFRVARDARLGGGATLVVRGALNTADSTLATVDARGTVRVEHYMRPTVPGRPAIALTDTTRMRRFALLSGRSRMNLVMPEARIWDLVRSAPTNATVGSRWVDTLRFETVHDGARVSLTGRRMSRVLRDTSVDGRRMLIVRDSAAVAYEEGFLIEAYMLDTTEHVDRKTTGTIVGQWMLDTQHGHVAWSADTTALRGTATLTGADGRTVSSPTWFERIRQVAALGATELAARNAGARPFSIVMVPFTALEKRMQQEGPAITDSLLQVVRTSRNPLERDSLLAALERWGRVPRERLVQEALLVGDTARGLETMEYLPSGLSAATLRAWLPVYDSRERLWRYGQTVDGFAERVAMRLQSSPPIVVNAPTIVRRGPNAPLTGSRDAACLPDACQLLADLWPRASDPRLRAVGLLTRAMQDPRGWGDSLRRHVRIAPRILGSGIALLDGVAAGWQASTKSGVPPAGSDWRRWSEWMTGQPPGASRPALPSGRAMPPLPITRFDESHRNAVAVHSAATGRDVVSDIRESFQVATGDSARLVFGTLATQLNAVPVTSALLSSWLSADSPLITTLGRNALDRFVADSAQQVDDAQATPLIDTLLAILIDQAPRWAPMGIDSAALRSFPAEMRPGTLRMYVDSLPPAVVARWSSRLKAVRSSERGVPDDQLPATTYSISRPLRAGRVVVLRFSLTTQRGPQAYAQGTTFYLLEVGGEYRLVSMSSWIT